MADCSRCKRKRPATYRVEFSYEEEVYQLDLCDTHIERFDREMSGWTEVARKRTPVAMGEWPAPRAVSHVPVPVTRSGEIRIPGESYRDDRRITENAKQYTFSEHAKARMVRRGITPEEIYEVLSHPRRIDVPSDPRYARSDCRKVTSLDIYVVVNPSLQRVLTVAWRTETGELE